MMPRYLKRTTSVMLIALLGVSCSRGQEMEMTEEQQLATAVLPAPPDRRAEATVLGYDASGALVTLREGANDFICLADEPGDDRFHASCYHESLEPFMTRGRELRAEGNSRDDVMRIREEEARAGTLPMPEQSAMLYVADGDIANFNPETNEIDSLSTRYVVYIPYATAESTGLPTSAPRGEPWIMDEGKPWAHIMLIPKQ